MKNPFSKAAGKDETMVQNPDLPEEPQSWDSLVTKGLAAHMAPTFGGGEEVDEDVEEPLPDSEEFDDDEEEEEEELEPEDDESIAPEVPEPSPQAVDDAQWAAIIRQKPVRINEVPAKRRAAVVEMMLANEEQAYIGALRQTAVQVETQVRAQIAAEADFAEIENLRAEDPESFRDWEDENPAKAESFRQYKVWKAQQGKPQAGPDVESLRAIAKGLLEKLPPDRLQDFVNRPNDYPATVEGVQKLQTDVMAALAPQPEDRVAQKRQAAVNGRNGLPQPDRGKGSPVGAVITDPLDKITDPVQLITIGMQRAIQANPGRQAVRKANAR